MTRSLAASTEGEWDGAEAKICAKISGSNWEDFQISSAATSGKLSPQERTAWSLISVNPPVMAFKRKSTHVAALRFEIMNSVVDDNNAVFCTRFARTSN